MLLLIYLNQKLTAAEDCGDASEIYAGTIFQALADVGGEALAVELGVVGGLEVFDEEVVTDAQELGVTAGYAAVLAAVGSEVDVGEDAAAGVFAPDGDLFLVGEGHLGARGDDH